MTAAARTSELCRVARWLPAGRRGPWEVRRLVVRENDLGRLCYMLQGRDVPPGEYTQLMRGGTVVMSDTPAEIRDCAPILYGAHGRVLINGLGLGMVPAALALAGDVEHVDVVELDPDVIELVAPHLRRVAEEAGVGLAVHRGDALSHRFPPRTRWDVAWHDVWDTFCSDNLAEMARLHRRYGGRVGSQASWGRWQCEALRRAYR